MKASDEAFVTPIFNQEWTVYVGLSPPSAFLAHPSPTPPKKCSRKNQPCSEYQLGGRPKGQVQGGPLLQSQLPFENLSLENVLNKTRRGLEHKP